jgi:RNA polymerase sigma factor (sigma-70 family)
MDHQLAEAAVLRAAGTEVLPHLDTPAVITPGDAADALFLEHAPRMRRVAIRKFGIPVEAADDLVHDVFVTYLVNPAKVYDLRKYLIGGICNASRKYWSTRAGENRVFVTGEIDDDCATVPEDVFEGLSVRLLVGATLARLGRRCREALRLSYLGESSAAMAKALSTTAGNANYLVHVCRKRAREIYERIGRAK